MSGGTATRIAVGDCVVESDALMLVVSEWIVSRPGVLGGKPGVRGTRISGQHILELFASGATREDVLHAHPQIAPEALTAALEYAARGLDEDAVWEVKVSA